QPHSSRAARDLRGPSLDSLLTPLYRRRSAEGLEAAKRRVLVLRSALVQMMFVVIFVLQMRFCHLSKILRISAFSQMQLKNDVLQSAR
ncbi:MAG: hypothetical protein ACI4L8_11205, partial [Candidatus Fimadaptatus sp.]